MELRNLVSLNEKLINKLRDACNSRSLLAKQVFQGEWTGAPECFVTKECTLYHNTKSAILDCITSDQAYIESQSMMDAIVIDLSVIIRSQAPLLSSGSTFDDFSLLVIDRIIKMAESCNAQKIDIVADQYTELSIKPKLNEFIIWKFVNSNSGNINTALQMALKML